MKKFYLFLVLVFLSAAGFAQTGTVKGKITDENGEMVFGATVMVEGTQKGAVADFDGNYKIDRVSTGQVTLVCSFVSYETVTKTVTVLAGKDAMVNFLLKESAKTLADVEIIGKANRESENILLLDQKKAVVATQAIGAQELSRKGVSNAGGAVAKISGVSKRDGVKSVFVRGLGDRYNTTTLNGFAIPSEDPEYKNISLDIFPSDMIQSVQVSKVFTASMHGDVGGALININSKQLVDDSTFQIGISTGINSQVPGSSFYLPDGINKFGYATASDGPKAQNGEQFVSNHSFNTSLDPIRKNPLLNTGISFSGGRQLFKKHRLFVVGAIDNKYQYQEGVTRMITATNPNNPYRDFDYRQSVRNASHLLAANLEITLRKSKLHVNSIYLHTATAAATNFYGKEIEIFQVAEDHNSEGLTKRLQINDNSVFINQLIYSGNVTERLKYNVGAAVNNVIGKEPDRRIMMFPSIGNGMVQLGMGEGRNQRFNSRVTEVAVLPKANLQYLLSADPEKISYLEVGYDSRVSNKDFSAPIYNYYWAGAPGSAPVFSLADMHLDAYFNQQNLSDGDFRLEHFNDTYNVVRNNHGVYADLIHKAGSKLTLNPGVRVDNIYTEINYEVNRGANVGSNTIEGLFLSPSLNTKYELNEKSHIRTGVSRTYTLPQDKEISPFIYQGIDGNDNGNPNLEASTNYNFDLKWDYYLSAGELLSVNGFYKHILNPIARVDQGNSAGLRTYDNVSDHAVATGIEVEIRKSLLGITDKNRVSAGVNASYIYTRVNLDPTFFVQNTTSSLEGAAPYILNADLTYTIKTNSNLGVTTALVLNYVSDKVHTIGTRGYNNLIEESITTLDLVTAVGIKDNLRLTLKARNLLNPGYKLSRKGAAADGDTDGVTIRSYKRGVLCDLGITYQF